MFKLLFGIFCFFSVSAMAEEIRLSCSMQISRTYSNGYTESRKEMVFADIETDGSMFHAQLKSDELLFSITSRGYENRQSTTEVLNISNENKWDITNFTKMKEISIESENYLYLDRNSGKINLRSEFTKNNKKTMTTNGSGVCEKINTKLRKF